MIKKLKLWFLRKFRGVDTTAAEFDVWFEKMLGRQLQGGHVYYAIAIQGHPGIPKIGNNWKLYGELKDAEKKRKRLQESSPHLTLELRVVRNYYSEV